MTEEREHQPGTPVGRTAGNHRGRTT
uniref:Uncharacterized protein n=1 Tax=Arundo donax TaxID=35708 RepID=A0A0A9H759_ARUDO